MSDPEIVVIGSGPNGLVAAALLARAGLRVLVLEAHPTRLGGAVGTEESTLPGFRHDVGAAFFPFAALSPAFRSLGLDRYGLRFLHAPIDSCHPAPDGSAACLSRDFERSRQHFGTEADGRALVELASTFAARQDAFLELLLGPLPPSRRAVRAASPASLLWLGHKLARSAAGLARSLFRSEAARRVMPSLGLHADVGPEDAFGAGLGFMLGMTAMTGGYAVPEGGAQSITDALAAMIQVHGGELRTGTRVERIVVRGDRAVAVVTSTGDEIAATRAILADTSAPALLTKLLDPDHVPARLFETMQAYPQGFATFKMDWALTGPVPWTAATARESAVVHTGDDLADLERFTRQVRRGELPDHPYLVIGQQSLVDTSRAPAGHHTLWTYSRVPFRFRGDWGRSAEVFADRIEARIEGLAPGFRQRIAARRIVLPDDLERMDANLIGGDLGGGSNAWHRQLVFRPLFPYFRYRMPVAGLYLASSYAHPGPGVHGMCGANAAAACADDLGVGPLMG